jgi:hypothetical protein
VSEDGQDARPHDHAHLDALLRNAQDDVGGRVQPPAEDRGPTDGRDGDGGVPPGPEQGHVRMVAPDADGDGAEFVLRVAEQVAGFDVVVGQGADRATGGGVAVEDGDGDDAHEPSAAVQNAPAAASPMATSRIITGQCVGTAGRASHTTDSG